MRVGNVACIMILNSLKQRMKILQEEGKEALHYVELIRQFEDEICLTSGKYLTVEIKCDKLIDSKG